MRSERPNPVERARKELKGIISDPERYVEDAGITDLYLEPGTEFRNLFACVYPRNVAELRDIISAARRWGFSVYTPIPWGLNPPRPGVVIDFRFMNRIIDIDSRNLFMELEPGVTWEDVIGALEDAGLEIALPACAMSPYVVEYMLNRGTFLKAARYSNRQFATFQALLSDGRLYRSGSDALPGCSAHWREDGGPNLSRVFTGSWNSFALPVKLFAYLYPGREAKDASCVGFSSLKGACALAALVARREIGSELIVLSGSRVKGILGKEQELPPWVVLIGVEGTRDYVSYQLRRVRELSLECGYETFDLGDKVRTVLRDALERPWYSERRTIGFCTTFREIERFHSLVRGGLKGVGMLSLMVVAFRHGASCYMHYRIEDPSAMADSKIKPFLRRMTDEGAFFPAPTGPLATHVFSKQPAYKKLLWTFKKLVDPGDILNTGQVLEV